MGNDIFSPPVSPLTVPLVFKTFLKFHWRAVGSSAWKMGPMVWSRFGVVLAELQPVGCPRGISLWRMASCGRGPPVEPVGKRVKREEWQSWSVMNYHAHSPFPCTAEVEEEIEELEIKERIWALEECGVKGRCFSFLFYSSPHPTLFLVDNKLSLFFTIIGLSMFCPWW